ncbi:hypothetical protein [Natronomonas sp.]
MTGSSVVAARSSFLLERSTKDEQSTTDGRLDRPTDAELRHVRTDGGDR